MQRYNYFLTNPEIYHIFLDYNPEKAYKFQDYYFLKKTSSPFENKEPASPIWSYGRARQSQSHPRPLRLPARLKCLNV